LKKEPLPGEDSQVTANFLDFIKKVKVLMASSEYKKVTKRLSEITRKYPGIDGTGKESKTNFSSGSNALFSSAIHGVFVGFWAEFELFLEVLFMNLAKTDEVTTSVVCATLQSGVKLQILKMLLNEVHNDRQGAILLQKARDAAARNMYVHGFWNSDEGLKNIEIVFRDVKSNYSIRRMKRDWDDAAMHLLDFVDAAYAAYTHFGINAEKISKYKRNILDFIPSPSPEKKSKKQGTHRNR